MASRRCRVTPVIAVKIGGFHCVASIRHWQCRLPVPAKPDRRENMFALLPQRSTAAPKTSTGNCPSTGYRTSTRLTAGSPPYLNTPACQCRFRLERGDCALFQNFRVLHSRTEYNPMSGYRDLETGYVDWSYVDWSYVDWSYIDWSYVEARMEFQRVYGPAASAKNPARLSGSATGRGSQLHCRLACAHRIKRSFHGTGKHRDGKFPQLPRVLEAPAEFGAQKILEKTIWSFWHSGPANATPLLRLASPPGRGVWLRGLLQPRFWRWGRWRRNRRPLVHGYKKAQSLHQPLAQGLLPGDARPAQCRRSVKPPIAPRHRPDAPERIQGLPGHELRDKAAHRPRTGNEPLLAGTRPPLQRQRHRVQVEIRPGRGRMVYGTRNGRLHRAQPFRSPLERLEGHAVNQTQQSRRPPERAPLPGTAERRHLISRIFAKGLRGLAGL